MNLIYLIKKNLSVLLRSKLTALILFLGPLLIVLIAGLAFNNSLSYDITIGVHVQNPSPLGMQFISDLENEFEVVLFQSRELCIDSVQSRGFHACLDIPDDLDIKEGVQNIIGFYFDNSRVNIASAIKQNIFLSVDGTSQNISQMLTSSILESLIFSERELTGIKDSVSREITRYSLVSSQLTQTKSSLEQSNLDFDISSLSLNDISSASSKVSSTFSALDAVAGNTLQGLTSTLDAIENLSISDASLDAEISKARDLRQSLHSALQLAKTNTSSVGQLQSLVSSLQSSLTTIDSNLQKARTNKEVSLGNINNILESISESLNDLESVRTRIDIVLANLKGQDVRDAASISQPVVLDEFEIVSGSKLNFLFPNLILLVIMFVTIITSATQIINEKLNKASLRVSMTPVSTFTNALATFLTILFITIIQITLILLLTQFFFGIDISTVWFSAVLVLLFATIFFTLLGISIGYIFNTEHTVMLGAISTASFFLILSDLILPIESMPSELISIMQYTPFILATNLLRKVMFFEIPLDRMTIEFYSLVGLCAGLLLLIGFFSLCASIIKKLRALSRARKITK